MFASVAMPSASWPEPWRTRGRSGKWLAGRSGWVDGRARPADSSLVSGKARARSRPPGPAEGALAVVEVLPDRQRYENALVLLQPLWARLGWHVVAIVVSVLVIVAVLGVAGATEGQKAQDAPASPRPAAGTSFEARWGSRLLMMPGGLAYGGVLFIRRLALRRRIEEWYQHASRTGADRIELHEDRLVLRDGDIPWSAVSDAAEIEFGDTHLLAVCARGLWGILPADSFEAGDLVGARSLMMRKLDGNVRAVIV